MKSIAHIREEDDCIQTVEEHLLEVKKLAEIYGNKIGVKHMAGLAGLLHDLGKYSHAFANYIEQAVYDPENAPRRGSVDHSTAGGKLLYDFFHEGADNGIYEKALAEIVGNVIISHHSYLHDFISPELKSPYLTRVKEKDLPEYLDSKRVFFEKVMVKEELNTYVDKAIEELKVFIDKTTDDNREAQMMFLTKFIFSALIDGDRTNTRIFADDEADPSTVEIEELFDSYYGKLMEHLNGYKKSPNANSPINVLRTSMSEQCDKFAEKDSGIYTLSIPTGGGKTLASLRYALKHAKKHNKKRIIYIVPYTTIIEQNAQEVRDILNDDEHILEHHSNVILGRHNGEDDIYISETEKKLLLAKDNWDSPIIFTTMVQFLNVFYAHGNRNIRRLHNLAESIIIFDEVQKVPVNCISLFNQSLNFLKSFGKSSIVLCTATQPALDFVNYKLDIHPDAEIVKQIDDVVEEFKRVQVIDKASDEQFNKERLVDFVGEELENVNNILIILNTKKVVKDLYDALKNKYGSQIPVYHLSTSMCPNHRTAILEEVKELLNNNQQVICVSTQLIEAGVDISFECVIRSLAGLDSIAQAAGRCNRHGENELQSVYVIDYIEENLDFLKEIRIGKRIAKAILEDLQRDGHNHGGNVLSPQAMNYYFQKFYKENEVELDYPITGMNQTIIELLMARNNENTFLIESRSSGKLIEPMVINNSYQTAARNFQVIDSPTTSVIVPYGEGKDIIAELNGDMKIEDLSLLFQRAQRFSVNVYSYQLELLNESGSLTTLFDEQVYALKEGAYDEQYGINIEGDSKQDLYAF